MIYSIAVFEISGGPMASKCFVWPVEISKLQFPSLPSTIINLEDSYVLIFVLSY
jgi:hypothetical protein